MDQEPGPEKDLLLLFPPRRLGSRILAAFSGKGYRVILFVLTEEDRGFFTDLKGQDPGSLRCFRLTAPLEVFWDGLDASVGRAVARARAVVNFVGRDYLALRVRGRGEEWRIDAAAPARLRIAFMELVLGKSEAAPRSLWINLASGQHGRSPAGEVFCNTKYGLTGFAGALELTPRLRNFQVINLCLTYFRPGSTSSGPAHCRHCLTQEALDRGEPLAGERDIPGYLLGRSEALWRR